MQQYQANATTPGPSSINEFVRIIDESKSKTTMRCMGSRLCTFLDKTQQFAGVADTFVSSNPSIAALVWGSVKMAILTANNVASYFEKVTNLIMSISKLCPIYEKFGGLYPGCVELQNELPFESDFKPFLELLEKSEKNVAREIQFASLKANQDAIKLQEFDSKKDARFRLDFYKTTRKQDDEANEWRIAKLKRDSERLRSRIRKNLTSIDHLTPWKQAIRERVSGTAEWLCQDDIFEPGKIFYLIIDGLDECDEKECDEVILNLTRLRQSDTRTLKIFIASRPDIEGQLFGAGKPQYRISVTEDKVKPGMELYIDVTLSRLLENGKLKLRDGRLIATISQALLDGSDGMILWTRLFIEELCAQGSDKEISVALTQLLRGLAELYDQKLRRVTSKPNVKNTTDMLRFCAFLKRSLTLLEYEDLLGIKPEQESHQPGNCPNDMIQVISNCCGLIFVDEEDSTVHYVHHSFKEHLLASMDQFSGTIDVADVDQHLGILCLTYLDFTDSKRQLARVWEGSNTPIQPLQLGVLPLPSVGRKVALEILSRGRHLRHLRSAEVERQTVKIIEVSRAPKLEHGRQRSYLFLPYAQTYWIDHLRELNVPNGSKIWRLFSQCVEGSDIPARRPWDKYQEADNRSDVRRSKWLLTHQHRTLLWYCAIHQTLTEGDHWNLYILVEVVHRLEHDCGLRDILPPFSQSLRRTTTFTFCDYSLAVASRLGCEDCIEYLIQAGGRHDTRINQISGFNAQKVLQAAVQGGHLQAVKTLTQAKVDINAAPNPDRERTDHQAAAGGGHLEVVNALIQAGADINAAPAQDLGRTALQAAAGSGHLGVVNTLLRENADVNAAQEKYLARLPSTRRRKLVILRL
ncbi:uncharacterized protein N7473_000391 [Penicillium subrubescens]|uniref:uncharacterized protein n=1 Tax=Penicillium subrubescens TaxID=1316194 RepID=UPI0025459C2B|nr:uncharacterized protein N7473_000391 [Penicillium subrubescens]KAJ5911088.1 hypothetical protein N7473_000391 [Penicillium subrubescens]